MEIIGKGKDALGAVWVARKIPDGYVSGHPNQARITTFLPCDPEHCMMAKDVVTFATLSLEGMQAFVDLSHCGRSAGVCMLLIVGCRPFIV